MKTKSPSVKNMLKPQLLVMELNELQDALSNYNHFLANYNAQLYCNNKAEVLVNKAITEAAITELKKQLTDFDTVVKAGMRPKVVMYQASALEEAAIMSFNNDNRFTITE